MSHVNDGSLIASETNDDERLISKKVNIEKPALYVRETHRHQDGWQLSAEVRELDDLVSSANKE
jgi:hypothetical protein